MKKLIIFDFDGTLVDSEFIASQIFPEVWSKMGATIDQEFFLTNFVGVSVDSPVVKNFMAQLPKDAMDIADKIFEVELEKSLRVVMGIDQLLKNINRLGLHQSCVASNSSLEYLQQNLKKTELNRHFENRVYSAKQVARPKPDPDLFLFAAKQLGYSLQDCIVVEDSVAGITAGKNAGMIVVGFMAGQHVTHTVRQRMLSAQPDHLCGDAAQLEKILINFN